MDATQRLDKNQSPKVLIITIESKENDEISDEEIRAFCVGIELSCRYEDLEWSCENQDID